MIITLIILNLIALYYVYNLGKNNKQNEILANRKKNKYKRIDDIKQAKERIKEGKL